MSFNGRSFKGPNMKKISGMLVLVLAVMVMLVVSCNNSPEIESVAYITFAESANARSLGTEYPIPQQNQLFWKYKAEKLDGGLNTGATDYKWLSDGNLGLSYTAGPFSMGNWRFSLNGYAKNESGSYILVYSGSVDHLINTTDSQSINVDVAYVGEGDGEGKILIEDIYLHDLSSSILSIEKVEVEISPLSYEGSSEKLVLTEVSDKFSGTKELKHGVYNLKFTFFDSANNHSGEITRTVLILAGRTTKITGNVSESVSSPTFTVTFVDDDPVVNISNYFYVMTSSQNDLETAIAEARAYSLANNTESYVVFDSNVMINSSLSISSSIYSSRALEEGQTGLVFDLNGNTLSYDGPGAAIILDDDSTTLKIQDGENGDGKIESSDVAVSVMKGSLEVNGGSLEGKTAITSSSNTSVKVTGGEIKGISSAINSTGPVIINGGNVTSENDAAIRTTSSVEINGDSNVSGRAAVMALSGGVSVKIAGNAVVESTDTSLKAIVSTGSPVSIETSEGAVVKENENGNSTVTNNEGSSGGFGTESSPFLVSNTDEFNNTAIRGGVFVKFLGDVRIGYNNTLTISYNMDLNGHTLFLDSPIFVNNGSFSIPFTVKNGTVISTVSSDTSALRMYEGAKFSAKNVNFTSPGNGILVVPNNNNVTISISDSTMNICGYYGVATNASFSDTQPVSNNIRINIENTDINMNKDDYDTTGILFNVKGAVDLKKVTIKSGRQAAVFRGGENTLKDCVFEIISNKNSTDYTGDSTSSSWGEGNQVAYAALVVGNKGNNAYEYPTKLTFSNLEVKLPGNTDHLALYVYQHSDLENRKVEVYGGFKNGSVTSVNDDKNGAVFSIIK